MLTMTKSPKTSVPAAGSRIANADGDRVLWLLDAPMFIDTKGVERLYDSVVRPATDEGDRVIEVQKGSELGLSLQGEAGASLGTGHILELFGFGKGEAKTTVGGEVAHSQIKSRTDSVTLRPIVTPERRLVQATMVYYAQHRRRLELSPNLADPSWYAQATIGTSPRKLVFLDLPGTDERPELPLTIIPTVAEFKDGKFDWIYKKLTDRIIAEYPNETVPVDPDTATDIDTRRDLERKYWSFFAETSHFKRGRHAMVAVEEASTCFGRIQWIDYRLPLDATGNTLHLHICPNGEFDTGVFAYQFIRRGYKHGLRIVGTLKSGPALDVLAIFEK